MSGVALVLAVVLAQSVTGPTLIAAVLLGQAAAAGMLGWMLSSLPGGRAGAGLWRTSLAVAGASRLLQREIDPKAHADLIEQLAREIEGAKA